MEPAIVVNMNIANPEVIYLGQNDYQKHKYNTDPAYREKVLQRNKENFQKRYHSDPDFAKQHIQKTSEYIKQRCLTDPDFCERRREQRRKADAKRRAAVRAAAETQE